MVRGVFVRLNFPYAQYAMRDLSADVLFPMVCIYTVYHRGLLGVACHTKSWKSYSYHWQETRPQSIGNSSEYTTLMKTSPTECTIHTVLRSVTYSLSLMYHTSSRPWGTANSFGHNYTNVLYGNSYSYSAKHIIVHVIYCHYYSCNVIQINNQHISWEHLKMVYDKRTPAGLTFCTKLTVAESIFSSIPILEWGYIWQLRYDEHIPCIIILSSFIVGS